MAGSRRQFLAMPISSAADDVISMISLSCNCRLFWLLAVRKNANKGFSNGLQKNDEKSRLVSHRVQRLPITLLL